MLNRRNFIAATALAPVFGLVARPLVSQISLGSASLITVSDGNLVQPGDFVLRDLPETELSEILGRYAVSRETLTPPCNLALYRDGSNTVLFDAGSGPDFMPTAGILVDSLDAAGVSTEEISHVVFTHAHPDHIWGLIDDFDELTFPNATYLMGRDEWDFWWDPDTVNTIPEDRMAFAVGAKRRMEAIEDQVSFFDDNDEVLPGILAVATYGHSPGHMAFEVRSGEKSVMICGDAIINQHVAFERPEWELNSDQDATLAASARVSLLDRLAHEKMPMIGFHLPGSGIGRVERSGSAYRFIETTDT